MSGDVRTEAAAAIKAGLHVVPVRSDGSKAPALTEWKTYRDERPPTLDEGKKWWPVGGDRGLGVLAANGFEPFDFDCFATYEDYKEQAAHAGLGELLERVERGYCDDTPGGGVRWLWRCLEADRSSHNAKLARRLDTGDGETEAKRGGVKVLVEMPDHCVVAPSNGGVHPSGRPYVRRHGGFDTVQDVSVAERDALVELARSFDQMPRQEYRPPPERIGWAGGRPGDDFTERGSWDQVLRGWTPVKTVGEETFYRRPGKDFGQSASLNYKGNDLFHVWSSSTPFPEADKSYTKFQAYTFLEHGGDFSAAAAELRSMGYGDVSAPSVVVQAEPGENSLRLVGVSSVPVKRHRWLWSDRLPFGGVTLMPGVQGGGKSTLTVRLMADISNGVLDGEMYGTPASCVYVGIEDSWSEVMKPRLIAAGADIDRIYFIEKKDDVVSLDVDLDHLVETLRGAPDMALLTIDPLDAHLGDSIDSHRKAEVQRAIAKLTRLSQELDCAVLGLAHLNKSDAPEILKRIIGSVGFSTGARSVLAVGPSPVSPGEKVVMLAKTNHTDPDSVLAIGFSIKGAVVPTDDGDTPVGVAGWTGVVEGLSANMLVESDEEKTKVEVAVEWLEDRLSDGGWHSSGAVNEAAWSNGITTTTLHRAKKVLGVESKKASEFQGKWTVRLPLAESSAADTSTLSLKESLEVRNDESPTGTGVTAMNKKNSHPVAAEESLPKSPNRRVWSDDDQEDDIEEVIL